ncbi:MAG: hypothetical protein KC912_25135 [Proteobacteria bacterium]|nr:hypothetical protein [Pseudomonadota bacterium]
MDPRFRLRRRYPGERLNEPRALGVRLAERDKPLKEARAVLGSIVDIKEPKVRASRSRVTAGPNAPLLKRLVLSPYRQDTARPRRGSGRDPIPWDVLDRPEAQRISAVLAERPEAVQGSVVRPAMVRLVARQRMSADDWLGELK